MAAVGGVALIGGWIIAIFTDGSTRAPAVGVLVLGVVLIFVGDRVRRDSKRRRMSEWPARESRAIAGYVSGDLTVSIVGVDERARRDGIYEVEGNGAHFLLGGDRARVGAEEWRLAVSRRRVALRSNTEELAAARRVSSDLFRWVATAGGHEFWIAVGADASKETSKSQVNMFGKDFVETKRRNGVVSATDGGPPLATVMLTYEVESKLTKRLDGNRDMDGEFDGVLSIRSSIPVPIAVLTLRLALSKWAGRTPQIGKWHVSPPAGA